MNRQGLGLVFLAIMLTWGNSAWAVSVEEVPNPRSQGRWVSDVAGAIDASAEGRMNQEIAAVKRDLGVEIAVVTVDEVDTATPKEFATELFNHWGIGEQGRDNGLLVLLVVGERRLEMETGYGTEAVLTDGWLKGMQGGLMVPHFRSGDYGTGLLAGVEASIARLRQYPDGIPLDAGGWDGGGDGGDDSVPLWPFFLLIGGGGVLGGAAAFWKHRRDRTCPQCKERMQMLPEEEDDAYLDEGKQTEEALGSVDYQFWYCADCGTDRLLKVGKWLSGYRRCPACTYKTLNVTASTIDYPTYTSTGLEEIVEDCAHCDHHRRTTRILPRKTRSTSSTSSFGGGGSGGGGGFGGGGSFGGGSSGGGGAGSSW